MDNPKKLPFEERRKLATNEVTEVLKKYDVDIIAIINRFPSTFVAQLFYVDLQDQKMLDELGIMKKPIIQEAASEKLSN